MHTTGIYYCTPLPLNLANDNKQASNKQQALLLSALAITPSQHYRLYSTLAILDTRWWPCQIQVLGPTLGGGAPGGWRQVGRCPLRKLRILCPKTGFFGPKGTWNPFKTDKQRETAATLQVRVDFTPPKSPLVPSASTICPRNAPKRVEKAEVEKSAYIGH